MKKHNNKKRNRFKAGTSRPQIKRRVINMQPEELAVYIRRAEKEVLPTIKDLELSAGPAIILLAQYIQALVTGDTRVGTKSANIMTNNVMELWETGLYQPGSEYPFSLEETRFDLRSGVQSQNDYSNGFQPF